MQSDEVVEACLKDKAPGDWVAIVRGREVAKGDLSEVVDVVKSQYPREIPHLAQVPVSDVLIV